MGTETMTIVNVSVLIVKTSVNLTGDRFSITNFLPHVKNQDLRIGSKKLFC